MRQAATHRWMPTISRSLQIMTAVVLVLIMAAATQQMLVLRASEVADAERQMARLDMVFAEQTGRAVETVDVILRGVIAALPDLSRQSPLTGAAGFDALLQRQIGGVQLVAEIAVVDADGNMVFSSRPANAPPYVLPAAGRTLLGIHAASPADQLQISEPMRDANGRWTALMTRPLRGPGGAFTGLVVATLNLAYFEDFYKAVELDENGAIQLHRRDGTVLARYPHLDSVVGTSFADLPPFKNVLAHEQAGTVVMTSPVSGERRIVAIRALHAFPLAVNVSVGESNMLEAWRQQTRVFLLAALLACLLIGTLLLLLSRKSRMGELLLSEYRVAKEAAETANAQLLVQMEERERAEAALRQAQRIEAVGQLTGGVAHDFNNLLTVLLGNIDLLQQSTTLNTSAVERLERMRAAAERGSTLTDQLLAFSRRQPLLPRPIALNEVVEGMLGLLQSAIGGTIRIQTQLSDELWAAMVDPTQIELVILNLAINARDAMPKGGTLTVETANIRLPRPTSDESPPEGDYVMVRVGDSGTGMTDEVKAKAFEPFFTTKGPGEGSGLGLSQVFGLARQSGGGVELESELGVGTSVRVLLPRTTGEPDHSLAQLPGIPAQDVHSTVLLVDDDEAVRSTTGMILEAMGYSVVEAESGREALKRLDGDPMIDILLTDVAMPGMNGPELARQVRQLRPVMPIVFFSGYADPDAVAGDAIRQRMVRKPFRAAELAAQIEAALAEHRASA
ncbi:MAG TPA: response regulator [Acetobacteraceae bacterium]|jgi:signal transduction histidine kinase/ActR/RegA family two-component response regulator